MIDRLINVNNTSDDDTRDRILNAAGTAFANRGFDATTVREICVTAEANVAAVNYHFGDKQRLYVETIKHAHQFRAQQFPIPDWPPGTPPEQRLRDFVRIILTRMLSKRDIPWQEGLMMREMLQPTGACQELVEDFIRPQFELLLAIIDQLLPKSTPAHSRHHLAFSVVGQCLFYKLNRHVVEMLISEAELTEYYSLDPLAEQIAHLTLSALSRFKQ